MSHSRYKLHKQVKSRLFFEPVFDDDGRIEGYLTQLNKAPIRGKLITGSLLVEGVRQKIEKLQDKLVGLQNEEVKLKKADNYDEGDLAKIMQDIIDVKIKLSQPFPRFKTAKFRVISWEKVNSRKEGKFKFLTFCQKA